MCLSNHQVQNEVAQLQSIIEVWRRRHACFRNRYLMMVEDTEIWQQRHIDAKTERDEVIHIYFIYAHIDLEYLKRHIYIYTSIMICIFKPSFMIYLYVCVHLSECDLLIMFSCYHAVSGSREVISTSQSLCSVAAKINKM